MQRQNNSSPIAATVYRLTDRWREWMKPTLGALRVNDKSEIYRNRLEDSDNADVVDTTRRQLLLCNR